CRAQKTSSLASVGVHGGIAAGARHHLSVAGIHSVGRATGLGRHDALLSQRLVSSDSGVFIPQLWPDAGGFLCGFADVIIVARAGTGSWHCENSLGPGGWL